MQCNKRHMEWLCSLARVEIARKSITHNVSFQHNSGLTNIKQSEPTAARRASFECLLGISSSHHSSKRLGRINDLCEVNGCVLRQCWGAPLNIVFGKRRCCSPAPVFVLLDYFKTLPQLLCALCVGSRLDLSGIKLPFHYSLKHSFFFCEVAQPHFFVLHLHNCRASPFLLKIDTLF